MTLARGLRSGVVQQSYRTLDPILWQKAFDHTHLSKSNKEIVDFDFGAHEHYMEPIRTSRNAIVNAPRINRFHDKLFFFPSKFTFQANYIS